MRGPAGVAAAVAVAALLALATPAQAGVDIPIVSVIGDDVSADAGGDGAVPGTGPSTGQGSGEQVAFTDIRLGRDGDVERVVWEFAGPGTPGWIAEYTTDPRQAGSGTPIPVTGGAVLQVVITGVGVPTDVTLPPGATPFAGGGPLVLSPESTSLITGVFPGSTFEGQQLAVAGLETQAPFRVYQLENPTRVVLEVVDEASAAAPTGVPAGDASAGWSGPMALPAGLVLVVALLGGVAVWSTVRRRGIA